MKKYKVIVYAICKNEEKFVDRWVDSMNEADEIYVLDTGSTDDSVNKLKSRGVHVVTKDIKPWRFDVARNMSLELVPTDADICVCTDLDEVFTPGWRNSLENIWQNDTDRIAYNYNWSLDENNVPIVNFYIEKIHTRKNYKWTHPVHEVLTYLKDKNESKITTDEITLNHYPDTSKSRSSYLPLLELSVQEDSQDDRNMHYLGREYMYHEMWDKSIDTLIKHLSLPSALWKDERSASMRFIARCYQKLNRYEEAKMWLKKAIEETPYLRDPYLEIALLYYKLEDWNNVDFYCNEALKITSHQKTYINETFSWDNTVYDLLSLAKFYKKNYDSALKYINYALEYSPNDERLLNNKKIILNEKNKIREN